MLLMCHVVHDIMVSGPKVKWLVEKLNQPFITNHLGWISHNNGCSFRDRKFGTLLIHQKMCGDKLVGRFDLTTSRRARSSPYLSVRDKEVKEEILMGLFVILSGD